MFNSLVNFYNNLKNKSSINNKTNTSTLSTVGNNKTLQTLSDAINSASASKNYGMSPVAPNQSKLSFSQYSSTNKVSPLTPAQYSQQGKVAPYNTATAPTTNAGYNSTIANAYRSTNESNPGFVGPQTPANLTPGSIVDYYKNPSVNYSSNVSTVDYYKNPSVNYSSNVSAGNTVATNYNSNNIVPGSYNGTVNNNNSTTIPNSPNYNINQKKLSPNMQYDVADPNTVASIYKNIGLNNDYTDPINSLVEKKLSEYLKNSNGPINENAIRKDFRDRIQAQIDSINNAYATMKAKAELNTTKNQGVAKAVNAKSGLLGSDFATADIMNIDQAGVDQQNALDAERAGKINAILTEADNNATSYIESERRRIEEASQEAMNNMLTRETRTAGNASKLAVYLASKGVTGIADISPDDLKTIQQNYGVDAITLNNAIQDYKTNKSKSDLELVKDRYVSIGDGAMLYDKVTGKKIENPKLSGVSTTYVPGENPIVDAFAQQIKGGTMTISQVPAEYRGLVTVAGNQGATNSSDVKGASDKLNMLINTINEARQMSNATSQGTISQGWQKLWNGVSDRDRLDSFANTLKTNVMQLFTDPTVKKFFGPQMSNADVQMMMSVGTPLSVNMTPAQFNAELDNLERRIRQALQDGSALDTTYYNNSSQGGGSFWSF